MLEIITVLGIPGETGISSEPLATGGASEKVALLLLWLNEDIGEDEVATTARADSFEKSTDL